MLEIVIFAFYALIITGVGLWVSRNKKGQQKNTQGYFLAEKSLPWQAAGSSLIAANISAVQFIRMAGSGFSIGLAISSYEWMFALTAAIVSSVASILNSTATIFIMDIYNEYLSPRASEGRLVSVGRMAALVAPIVTCCAAPPLGNIGQAFRYVHEYGEPCHSCRLPAGTIPEKEYL